MSKVEHASERKAFKDYFDKTAARALARQVAAALPKFDRGTFVRLASRKLGELEFAGRIKQFADALAETLPASVPRALEALTTSLPEPLPDCEQVTDGWLQWPIGQFIADHGLEHFEPSMQAMIELTKRFSSEFAVRPFVEHHPERTFKRLLKLTADSNPHVRRWCSEGVRPRLPWGKKLTSLVADPTPIFPVVEALKGDDELYVRRSVANNLNDIAKDHPSLVIARCKAWSKSSNANRDWVIKHGLRTLIKAGDPAALRLIGFAPPQRLAAKLTITPKRITIGDSVLLTAHLTNNASRKQKLLIDYVVHFVRQGAKTSAKVFKWTHLDLPAGATTSLEKRHPMKPTTIRALYPGEHRVELQVNGVCTASSVFRLA